MSNEVVQTSIPEEEAEEIFAFPASFAQQRLWFVDQLAPGKAIYNIPYHHQTRLRGRLNVAALAQALQAMVDRHEPLRTTFTTEQGEPVQVILPEMTIDLPVIDISHLAEAEREAEMQRIINEEARHTFDLATGPLFYAKLLKLADEDHVFIFMIHHITVDALSLDFFAEELPVLYEAFATGKPSSPAGTASAICRFCHLAARVDAGRCAPGTARLLAGAAKGESARFRTANGSPPTQTPAKQWFLGMAAYSSQTWRTVTRL